MKIGSWKVERERPEIWKGALAGLIGGLVATAAMTRFQGIWSDLSETFADSGKHRVSHTDQGGQKEQQQEDDDENSTEKVASIIAETVFDRSLSREQKKTAGIGVHYAFGALTGGAYGAAAETMPEVSAGGGIPFGAGVWLAADEITLPLTGLSKPPTAYPLSLHAYALSAHVVYGLTAEIVRRLVRRVL